MALPHPKVLNLASWMTPEVVDLQLQLHHVAAFRRADDSGADIRGVLVEAADVARIVVMVKNFF